MFGACSRRSQKDKRHKTSPDLIALDHSRGMCSESMNGVDAQYLPNRNSHGCTFTCTGLPQQRSYTTCILHQCLYGLSILSRIETRASWSPHCCCSVLPYQLHSHWSPPSEFGLPAEKDNRGFISCENPPLLTPGDNKPSCEIIKMESSRCGGIISIWFPHSETS